MGDKGDFIAVIEGRAFLSECIRRSMQPGLPLPVLTYSTSAELERQRASGALRLVILSLMDASSEASASALKVLSELVPGIPIIVLANKDDVDLARTVFSCGAKGFSPLSCSPFQAAGGNILLLAIERFRSTAVRQGKRHDHENDG